MRQSQCETVTVYSHFCTTHGGGYLQVQFIVSKKKNVKKKNYRKVLKF